MMDWPEWLPRAEASNYLRTVHGVIAAPATLANLAHRGGGPQYTRQGRRLTAYHRNDLDVWAATRMSRRVGSTRELRQTLADSDVQALAVSSERQA
jgi:hypothetical protein